MRVQWPFEQTAAACGMSVWPFGLLMVFLRMSNTAGARPLSERLWALRPGHLHAVGGAAFNHHLETRRKTSVLLSSLHERQSVRACLGDMPRSSKVLRILSTVSHEYLVKRSLVKRNAFWGM